MVPLQQQPLQLLPRRQRDQRQRKRLALNLPLISTVSTVRFALSVVASPAFLRRNPASASYARRLVTDGGSVPVGVQGCIEDCRERSLEEVVAISPAISLA